MPRTTDTRTQMLRTAGRLFQRQGYAATGWRQVVAEAGTPWGSQAHHFPGGKEQLATEALARAGAGYERLLRALFIGDAHPADAVEAWVEAAAAQLAATGWAEGCPVATVALETAHQSDALASACGAVFESWRAALTEAFVARGLKAADAASLALLVLSAIEGALLLSRAARDAGPLRVVGNELSHLLRARVPAAVAAAPRRGRGRRP